MRGRTRRSSDGRTVATSGWHGTGVALGMFDGSTYAAAETTIDPGDALILYSDGITEAEDPAGRPFEEAGSRAGRQRRTRTSPPPSSGRRCSKQSRRHANAPRFSDDLTILILKRLHAHFVPGLRASVPRRC